MVFLTHSFNFYFSRFRITGMGFAQTYWFSKGAKFRKFFGFTKSAISSTTLQIQRTELHCLLCFKRSAMIRPN